MWNHPILSIMHADQLILADTDFQCKLSSLQNKHKNIYCLYWDNFLITFIAVQNRFCFTLLDVFFWIRRSLT